MQITNVDTLANPEANAVDLPVSSAGMVITVGVGDFVVDGTAYSITEDATATISADVTHKTYVTVYLCKEKSTGDLKLVVDELIKDPNNMPLPFEFGGSPYDLLFQLAYAEVAPGALDLDSAPATVWRVVSNG